MVLVVAAFALTVVIGMLRGSGGAAETVEGAAALPSASAGPAASGGDVFVHVAGAVAVPGLYALVPGARVADAIAAAGGFSPDAERGAVNLARPVVDGEQVLVPVVGAAPPPPATGGTSASESAVVDLNTADEAALDTLPGVGPAIAGRIIAWREENGRFTAVEDLLAVSGIGEKLLADVRDLVRV